MEVALTWTMASAARCENRVRATTRPEASAQGRHTLTLLPPLLVAPAAQLPASRAEGVLAQCHDYKAAEQEPNQSLWYPGPQGGLQGVAP